MSLFNPVLWDMAQDSVYGTPPVKGAMVPAPAADPSGAGGGAPPAGGDSMAAGGGAPAPAPAAPPMPADPGAMANQMAMQAAQGMGPAAMPAGKAGGKKAEQQLIDTKLWIIQYLLVQVAQKLDIQLPPSVVIGPPPDPMAMQTAQADSASGAAPGAPMPSDPNAMAAGGAAPGGAPAPAPGGDPTKMAAWLAAALADPDEAPAREAKQAIDAMFRAVGGDGASATAVRNGDPTRRTAPDRLDQLQALTVRARALEAFYV